MSLESLGPPGPRFAPGPRAVEAGLLTELDSACAQSERDPALLARPLRVVVPSRALREQTSCALARASALLRVAAQISRELAEQTLGYHCAELARAADLLRSDAELLPTRALWIHGFNDATGVQLDLLETLALRFASRVWLDRPAAHRAGAFGARLRERIAPVPGFAAEPAPDASIRASRHADPEAEARAAPAWARERIDAGITPEQVAIAARDLARHRFALRRQLGRLGGPFSGVAERGGA